MNPKIYIHADDFGIGNSISEKIVDCIHNGAINSVSIVCNTPHFYSNAEKYENTLKEIRCCLHLNLVEGKPVSDRKETGLIANTTGEFNYSFLTLWLAYNKSNKITKALLKQQIKSEIENQIIKYTHFFGKNAELNIDSHMHFHMIPFVFDCIMELSEKYKINFIRIPYELRYHHGLLNAKNHMSLNLVKNVLLNSLSKRNVKLAAQKNIKTNDYFIGVLSTGRMTEQDVAGALDKIRGKAISQSIDILFHPGGVASVRDIDWTKKKAFISYYSATERLLESEVLKSKKFKNTIQKYETFFDH